MLSEIYSKSELNQAVKKTLSVRATDLGKFKIGDNLNVIMSNFQNNQQLQYAKDINELFSHLRNEFWERSI